MSKEYISQNEYMRRYKIGFNTLKKMIADKEVDVIRTDGGQYRIKITDDNTVSKELYERTLKRAIEAENTLKIIQNILIKN